jgi:hypothetical protein
MSICVTLMSRPDVLVARGPLRQPLGFGGWIELTRELHAHE